MNKKKDLLVYVADSDAAAVMKSVLGRHHAIGIHEIDFDIKKHPNRDSGMVTTGPELAKLLKEKYRYMLMIWDYHGCGLENRKPKPFDPPTCCQHVQKKLNLVTWSDRSATSILVPELEEWLWHNQASIRQLFGVSQTVLEELIEKFSRKNDIDKNDAVRKKPKELFQALCHETNKPLTPRDYEKIGKTASLTDWQKSDSFCHVIKILQRWFPPNQEMQGINQVE